MSLSPRRLLRPWRKKSFGSILSEAEAEETISAVDHYYGNQERWSKKNHGITVAREEPQLDELQEELGSLGSIVTAEGKCSSREQVEATPVQHFNQRQPLVSQQFDQDSNAQESRDDESPNTSVHEIQYTYKTDYRPMEDRNIKELFKLPPPDGTNLRTVQELLEGSDSLAPWLRDMLVNASVKVKQNPFASNEANASKHARADSSFLRFESDDISLSEAEEEGTTVMSSFSELSETMDDSANLCNFFPFYF